MKKLVTILFAASFLLILNSCSKEDDDTSTTGGGSQEDRTELISNSWMIKSVVVDSIGIDVWPFFPTTCQKDDLYVFVSDGTGYIDQNTMICDSTAPQKDIFTWTWQNGENDLMIALTDSTISLTDIDFKGGEMSGKTDAVINIPSLVTFTKQ